MRAAFPLTQVCSSPDPAASVPSLWRCMVSRSIITRSPAACQSQRSPLQIWLGLLPNQLVFVALTTGLAACLMPRRPTDCVPLTKVSRHLIASLFDHVYSKVLWFLDGASPLSGLRFKFRKVVGTEPVLR